MQLTQDYGVLDFSGFIFRMPYQNSVPIEEHKRIQERCERWLYGEGLANFDEIMGMRARELTLDEWNVLENKRDYRPIANAKFLSCGRNVKLMRDYSIRDRNLLKHNRFQLYWIAKSVMLFLHTQKRFPSSTEEAELTERMGAEFLAFRLLKENALGESIEYPDFERVIEEYSRLKREFRAKKD